MTETAPTAPITDADLFARLEAAEAKLDFLNEKGLSVGLMKTSDKSEPYLAYVIEPHSELCDLETMRRLTEAEIRADKAEREVETWKLRADEKWAQHDIDTAKKYGATMHKLMKAEQRIVELEAERNAAVIKAGPPYPECNKYAINMKNGEQCGRCDDCRRAAEVLKGVQK